MFIASQKLGKRWEKNGITQEKTETPLLFLPSLYFSSFSLPSFPFLPACLLRSSLSQPRNFSKLPKVLICVPPSPGLSAIFLSFQRCLSAFLPLRSLCNIGSGSASGSERGYSTTEFMDSNQNVDNYFSQGNVDEKEAEAKGNMNKVVMEAEEEENEIQKLLEELMAYEKYMKFYQIPYYDGQLKASNNI